MYSRFLNPLVLVAAGLLPAGAAPRVLRVCADPNNLPYSNQRGEGFENRLAELLAKDLGAKLEYTWWSQRRSFIKNSLGEGRCDALMGVPAVLDSLAVTNPYYHSTYVFISRENRHLNLTSLTDPQLGKLRIGIHMVGDDYAPPAIALGRLGFAANVVGYRVSGAYGEENPPSRLVNAVAQGDVDVAVVWGPFAGYFAKQQAAALEIAPLSPSTYLGIPFTYEMSMGVRKGDEALRAELNAALQRNCAAIEAILEQYGVPQVQMGERKRQCERSQELRPASR